MRFDRKLREGTHGGVTAVGSKSLAPDEAAYPAYPTGMLRRLEQRGLPLELLFRDERSGREVSLQGLRSGGGVLDFWATTCAPCIAELPRMKELQSRFAPRGVEFIGISLDEPQEQGGRQALREFLKKHEVPWPQYYQGQCYESAFSMSWGAGSVPTLFVLDRQGCLSETPSAAQLSDSIAALLQTKGR